MHRATRLTLGTVGIGLLAAFLVLGLSGATIFASGPASPASHGGSVLATSSARLAPTPAVANATTIWANVTAVPLEYSHLPTALNFTLAVAVSNNTFTISSATVNATVWLVNELTEATLVSIPVTIGAGQTVYSQSIDSTSLGCSAPDCVATLGDIAYAFFLYAHVNAASANGTTSDTNLGRLDSVSFVTVQPTFGGVGGTSVTAGNITVTVTYAAQYVTLVTLNIFNSTAILVYTNTFQNNATTGAPQSRVWFEATNGVYTTSVVGSTPWNTFYTNSTITVVPASSSGGGVVYQNTTNWINKTGGTSATGYFGLNAPVSGTLFLLIGLIVGILAALVAARMMMSDSPAKPAQPWSDKKGDAANTCSVCGKSFGSADELAAHAKSEHGVQ